MLTKALHDLFVKVWETGTVPRDWRTGVILPLYKGKGSKSDCGNHRGITLLSVPGKAFAHILLNRIKPLLLEKRRPQQSGFSPGRSTVDRILDLNLASQTGREFQHPLYVTYVDLKAAFDSVYRPALWQLLKVLGVPEKVISLVSALYSDTTSRVRVDGQLSSAFPVSSGVRQGCVLAPDLFNTGMDWVLGRAVGRSMNGAVVGTSSLTDFDYADDVALLAELIALLQSALEILSQEAAPIGLQVNWAKTKIQSLSDFLPKPDPLVIDGQTVEAVDGFVYLGSLVDTSCRSSPEIRRRIGIARQTFKDLERGVWRSKLTLTTKLRIYNVSVIAGLLYAGETWTMTAADYDRLDAFDSQCLRRILGIRWQDFVTNAEVRRRTQQPLASITLKARRLSLFGHTARLAPTTDTRVALDGALVPPRGWKRPRGRPRKTWLSTIKDDLAPFSIGLFSAVQKAQDRQGWRSLTHRATLA